VLGVFWVPFIRRNGVRYMQATTLRRNPTQTQPCMRARDVRGADVIVDRRPRDDRPFKKGGGICQMYPVRPGDDQQRRMDMTQRRVSPLAKTRRGARL
jgi:hypothetical protein